MTTLAHLNRREARVREQLELARLGPVVSFTAVSPGPAKDDAVACRIAAWSRDAVAALLAERGWGVLGSSRTEAATGPEWLLAVDADPLELKRALVALEDQHPWGRLADLDVVVLDADVPTPLGRRVLGLPPRACLLCGQDAAACARSARHPLSLLLAERAWLAREGAARDAPDPDALADLAVRALVVEAELTPKPGLVDAANSGAHADMDLGLLRRSAQTLRPWLRACVQAGAVAPGDPAPLVALGVDAESAMLAATGGVNTHRGALFSLGLTLGALGAGARDVVSLRSGVAALAQPLLDAWLERPTASHGTLAHQQTGALGARGEAASGFATVFDVGLSALLRRRTLFGDEDDALRWVLVALIAEHDDTNLIARGGAQGLRDAQAWASGVLRARPDEADLVRALQDADRWFTERRLSPGGSADLLALTWFLWRALDEHVPRPRGARTPAQRRDAAEAHRKGRCQREGGKMSILVVGASGGIGGAVVEGLAARGESVRASSRNPERLSLAPGVETVRVDLESPDTLRDAADGVERVFLYADAGDPDALTAALREAGVKRVVLLSSHAAARLDAASDFNGARFHRAESALAASGLEWTFLRPGSFCGNALRWRWEIARGSIAFAYPESPSAPVHEQDIVDVAIAALTSDALVGRAPILTGPQSLTLREQVQAIGTALGRAIDVVTMSDEQARASLARHVPQAWADYLVDVQRDALANPEEVSGEYQQITGRPPRTFAQWAVEHADAFRG